jgi:hypothetical protein
VSNVGYATVSIIPSAKGFGPALNKQIGPMGAAAGAAGGKKAGLGFKGAMLAPLAALGPAMAAAMGGVAVGSFLKDAVGQASDLNEVGTALKTVFGDGLGEVEKFGDRGAKALGMSRLAALQAAQSFGVYGKAAGLGGKANAEFSTGMASLATDLASFYNSSPEEAIEALGSGLRGEAEPLRKFGILLDDATLRQQALKMGLVKTTKEALTPQQKILASHAVIMKQSKIAQGDFAKTSGGLANQQRILSAQWTDLKGKIGGAFLPAVLGAVKGLNGLFDSGGKAGGVLARFRPIFDQIVPVVKTLAASFMAQAVPALRQLGQIIMTQVVPAVISVARYLAANLLPIARVVYTIFATQVIPIVGQMARFLIGLLVPAVIGVVKAVASNLKPVLDTLFNVIHTRIIPVVLNVIAKFREWMPTIQRVITVVVQVISWILRLAAAILGKVLPPLIRFAAFLLVKVVGAVLGVIGVVVKVIGKIVEFGSAVVRAVGKVGEFVSGLKRKFGEALTYVKGIPGNVTTSLGDLGSRLYGAGEDLIRGFLNGIKNMAANVARAAADVVGNAIKAAKEKLGIHSPSRVFMEIGGYTAEGMAIGMQKGAGMVTKAADALAYAPSPSVARGSAASSAASSGDNVYHLYDTDGTLMATMRGAARAEVTAAARGIVRGTR